MLLKASPYIELQRGRILADGAVKILPRAAAISNPPSARAVEAGDGAVGAVEDGKVADGGVGAAPKGHSGLSAKAARRAKFQAKVGKAAAAPGCCPLSEPLLSPGSGHGEAGALGRPGGPGNVNVGGSESPAKNSRRGASNDQGYADDGTSETSGGDTLTKGRGVNSSGPPQPPGGVGQAPFHLADYDLVLCVRFLVRGFHPQLANMIKPGGYLLYYTFYKGSEAFGHPSKESHILQEGELATEFGTKHGWQVLVDRVEHLPDGRPMQAFLARRPFEPSGADSSGPEKKK